MFFVPNVIITVYGKFFLLFISYKICWHSNVHHVYAFSPFLLMCV
jgi:hypothetical protein